MNIEQLQHRFPSKPAKIVVVGSINLDLSSFVESFPLPHQTISAKESNLSAGGKGFNQAVAAARAGADVFFIGCIGNDVSGQTALEILNTNGVNTEFVRRTDEAHTGTANIMVDASGANMIAVSAGANSKVTTADLDNAAQLIAEADIMLCQLECPLNVVRHALVLSKSSNTISILNPAPVVDGARDLVALSAYVTPNETEAKELTDYDPTVVSERQLSLETLLTLGSDRAVITLGSEGAFINDQQGATTIFEAFKVKAVNTTGAGDVFNGTFSTAIARDYSFFDSVVYASAASAISVTGKSAYDSAPTHHEIIDFIGSQQHPSFNLDKAS